MEYQLYLNGYAHKIKFAKAATDKIFIRPTPLVTKLVLNHFLEWSKFVNTH